jgi:TonB family protein
MKTAFLLRRAADSCLLGLAVAFTGCANTATPPDTSAAVVPSALAADRDYDPPKPLRVVTPVYPFDLKRLGVAGLVNLSCVIDEHGRVHDPQIENATHSSFGQAARDALEQWTFTPATRDGAPFAVRVSVPIQFILNDD